MAGFEVVGTEQVSSVVLFDQLRTGLQNRCGKEQILQPPLGAQLHEQARGTVEADRGDWGRGLAVTVELEMGGQPNSEHVMLLGAFLGDQGFQRTPKELLVALGSGADDIDEQVSPGHGRDKAGVAGACGEAPRRVAASQGEEQPPEPRARLVALALWGLMDSESGIYWGGLAQQVQEGLQSGAVGVCGIELDLGGKHSRPMESQKDLFVITHSPLAFFFS